MRMAKERRREDVINPELTPHFDTWRKIRYGVAGAGAG